MAASPKARLERLLCCEASDDSLVREFYSVDASHYRIRPQVVVFPESEGDIAKVVRFAGKNDMTVTPRGAGTGLVGGALGEHIVLDFRRMDRMRIGGDSVTVQPGVIKGVLDERLAGVGKFLSPDPSVGRYCSLGGMVGTNASGSHALKYGSIIDNILRVTIIDGRGNRVTLPDDAVRSREVFSLSRKIERARFPRLSKNSCGYRLDAVHEMADSHRVIAGSEGTLGIVTSAELRIRSIPKERSLLVAAYKNVRDIHDDVNRITRLNPSALEFLDGSTIGNIAYRFPEDTAAALFIEVDDDVASKATQVRELAGGRVVFSTSDEAEIQRWWGHRNSALAYSMRAAGEDCLAPHIIEDSAVPIKNLRKIFDAIDSVNGRFKTRTVVYGHAGNGNLHVRLIAGRRSRGIPSGAAAAFFDEVIRLGGTITAEHGDGIARSGFVRRQYGERNYGVFRELKAAFDPKGVLNPGKIIARQGSAARDPECRR